MLKLSITISFIISICLINLHINTVAATTTETSTSTLLTNSTSSNSSTPIDTSSSISTHTHTSTQSLDKIHDSEKNALMASSLALLAAAVVAPTYLIGCSGRWSVWLYAGVSLLYVGAEIINWGKYEEASDLAMTIYDNNDKDTQVESFTTAENITRKAADAAYNKAKYAKWAGYGYMTASVLALVESFEFWKMGGRCNGANPKKKAIPPKTDSTNNIIFNKHIPFLDLIISPFIIKTALSSLGDNNSEKIALGVGLVGAGVLYLFRGQVSKFLFKKDAVMQNGLIRSALFGATAALAINASSRIEKAADKLDERANEYLHLKNQLSRALNSNRSAINTNKSLQSITSPIIIPKNTTGTESKSVNCFTGETGSLIPDPNCDCEITNTCKTSELSSIKLGEIKIPTLITDTIGTLENTSNKLYQGDIAGATTAASELTNKSAANIKKLKKSIEKQINNRLKNEKKPPFEFEKHSDLFKKDLSRIAKSALNGLSPANRNTLLSNLGIKSLSKIPPTNVINKLLTKNKNSKGKDNMNRNDQNDSNSNLNFEFLGPPNNEEKLNKSDVLAADKVKYNYNERGGIKNDPNASLFKTITLRYLKSAYSYFFNE